MSDSHDAPDGFLSRWSRRKALLRQGEVPPEPDPVAAPGIALEPAAVPAPLHAAPPPVAVADVPPPAPTLEDVAQLGRGSDFRRFVAPGVTPEVKNAAMKKLFTDPHFNVMDGLDTYIDDYGKPDPIPAAMLRKMVQSHALGLFADEDEEADKTSQAAVVTPDGMPAAEAAQSPPEPLTTTDDDQDAALRLQPLDAAGPPCDPRRAEQDAGRER